MLIFQCSQCGALISPGALSTNWYFNGDCWQHNCKGILKIATEDGRIYDYKYASKKLSVREVLKIVSDLKTENKRLRKERNSE